MKLVLCSRRCDTNKPRYSLSLHQIHSIHQRRKVIGRSKNFDQLVAELKMVSKNRERSAQSHEESAAQSPSTETPREPNTAPLCRRPLSNSPAFRYEPESEHLSSRIQSESFISLVRVGELRLSHPGQKASPLRINVLFIL